MLLTLTSTAGRTSCILLAEVIPWINQASLALYNSIMHATTAANLKFGSCTVLSSLSPMIEASKLVTVEVKGRESVLDSISAASMWLADCARTVLTTFYHNNIINYAATRDVVKYFIPLKLTCVGQL